MSRAAALNVNLIPAHRRAARARRRRMRVWVAGGITYTAAVLAVCAALRLTWDRESRALAARLTDAAATVKAREGEVGALRHKVAELTVRRQNAKALMDQPDWSILLAALGQTVGEEAILRDIRLMPAAQPTAAGAPAAPGPPVAASAGKPATSQPKLNSYTLELRGLCRSPSAVSRFVLRLQESGLFDDVKLVRTSRDPAAQRDASTVSASSSQQQPQPEAAVTFELGCTIGDRVP